MRNVAIIIIALAACTPKRQTDYASNTEVYSLEGSFQVEVTRVRVDGHKLEVRFAFTNLNDGALAFKRDNVWLKHGERQVRPREAWNAGERDVDFHVKGQQKRKAYIFDLEPKGAEVKAGEYQITFAGFRRNGSDNEEMMLKFPIKVP